MAFDEIRLAAAGMPTVCIYLLEVLHLLEESMQAARSDAGCDALRDQARLVRDGAGEADLLPHDRQRIEDAHRSRFGD